MESFFFCLITDIIYIQGGDIEKATDWIFNNPNASVSDMDVSSSSSAQTPAQTGLPDGGGS